MISHVHRTRWKATKLLLLYQLLGKVLWPVLQGGWTSYISKYCCFYRQLKTGCKRGDFFDSRNAQFLLCITSHSYGAARSISKIRASLLGLGRSQENISQAPIGCPFVVALVLIEISYFNRAAIFVALKETLKAEAVRGRLLLFKEKSEHT